MNKLVWTAIAISQNEFELIAQCKSSRAELLRRISDDDPIWAGCVIKRRKMMKKHKFKRGLAIACAERADMV